MSDSNQNTAAVNSAANQRRNFLEQTRLSRIPPLPKGAADVVAARRSVLAVCVNCKSNLKNESEFACRVSVCAKCLQVFAIVEAALNASADRKIRDMKLKEFTAKFNLER